MASAAQIAANQANALKSTGPKSPPGKAMSSRNSLKHGLSGRGVVLPEAEEEAVAERIADWRRSYAVRLPHEEFALREMARESVRIERCNAEDVALRGRMVVRAADSWDDDRRIAAEELGRTIHRDPSPVSRKLQMTPQGCDWLIVRWEGLAHLVESGREWADEHSALASDLLGIDPELRDGPSPLDLPEGDVSSGVSRSGHRLAAIRAEIARLRARRDGVVSLLDADDRALARQGVEVEPDRPLGRLRRYAAACRRRFDAAAKVLKGAAERLSDVRARHLAAMPARDHLPSAAEDAALAKLFLRSARAEGERREAAAAGSPAEPVPTPRPMSRQQRRALARRRPEPVLA